MGNNIFAFFPKVSIADLIVIFDEKSLFYLFLL